jgi:predicted HTH transcriptional regulator
VLRTLEEALADRERQDVEFKESLALANDAARALVGFANSQGGQVFFGVTDAGQPKGGSVGRKTIEDLGDKLDR